MATIYSLKPSITQLPLEEVYSLVHTIRASRRRLRTDTLKPKVVRVSKAATKKKSLNQEDLFSLAKGMTPAQKAKLAASLLNL